MMLKATRLLLKRIVSYQKRIQAPMPRKIKITSFFMSIKNVWFETKICIFSIDSPGLSLERGQLWPVFRHLYAKWPVLHTSGDKNEYPYAKQAFLHTDTLKERTAIHL